MEMFILLARSLVAFPVLMLLQCFTRDPRHTSDHITRHGRRALNITLKPFGDHLFGQSGTGTCRVICCDADGMGQTDTCKTWFFTGIYRADPGPLNAQRDRASYSAPPPIDGQTGHGSARRDRNRF